ncbi:MAG TPA: hypothetical protein PKA20_21055 [Burkholderiaceae bacterium]|nr:hypothetical protein [Burkholderiaceae bacterium]
MAWLLVLHLCAAGAWIGCVLTEVAFERLLAADGAARRPLLANLHARVDVLVETPAMLIVAATGASLLARTSATPMLLAKIICGLLALAANVWCVAVVMARRRAAAASDGQRYEALDRLQHRLGALVVLGLAGALAIGLGLAAGG